MRRLVILRPEPGASASVARARALGLEAVAIPLFELRPLEWSAPDPGGFDALLVTSANAVRHGGAQLRRLAALPVHAVGGASAQAARGAGLALATVGQEGVAELLAQLAPGLRLLHPCGRQRRDPGPTLQTIARIAVYDSVPLPPPPGLADTLPGAVVALHSPRAARRLAELVDAAAIDRAGVRIAAISAAAATAAGAGWGACQAADRPTDAALLALAVQLCDKGGAR